MKQILHYFIVMGIATICIFLYANTSEAQSVYDIYVLDVKTGATKRVTTIPSTGEWNASWSNNGKKIAHDYTNSSGQAIYITDVQTGVSTPLAGAETGNDAAWSPDGERISFDDWEDVYHIGWWSQNIYTVPAGGGSRSFFRFGAHHATWNPAGNKMAFDDNNGYIATKDLNTGAETFVTYYGDRPSWSPNGQYIAFDGWGWIGGGVWIIKVDTVGNPIGWPVQLTTSGYGPTWKNNSKEIVFIDWPNGDPDLYSISITGGIPTRVGGRVGGFDKGDYDPAYSNNGQFIAWSSYTDDLLTIRSTKPSQVTELSSTAFNAVVYPNPVQSTTTLRMNGNVKNTTVIINDINGQTLWHGSYSNRTQITLPTEKLKAGIYTVTIKGDKESRTIKLVKE